MAFGLVDEVVHNNDDGQKFCRLSSFCRMQEVLLTLPIELDRLHSWGSLHPGSFFASPISFAFGALVLECSHLWSQLCLAIISENSAVVDVVEVEEAKTTLHWSCRSQQRLQVSAQERRARLVRQEVLVHRDPAIATRDRSLGTRKEKEVGFLLGFLYNPTRTLPCNSIRTPTL
jgi:hypothetical protein